MYSGIAGMKNFQTKLDVIGNNIANVNTAGFKKGRVTFQDMLSQTSQGAQGFTEARGGINAKQVGTGSQIGSIDNIHTQGFQQNTTNTLDMMVQGDGMFVIDRDGESVFTRSGNFTLDGSIVKQAIKDADGTAIKDEAGNDPEVTLLVNSDGYRVLNTEGNPIYIPKGAESMSVQKNGSIAFVYNGKNYQTEKPIALASMSNPSGLEKIGANLYRNTPNTGFSLLTPTAPNKDIYPSPGSYGTGDIISGVLEMSNVDLSEEFTEMITAQRAFQANTRIITTSDEILQELVNLKR